MKDGWRAFYPCARLQPELSYNLEDSWDVQHLIGKCPVPAPYHASLFLEGECWPDASLADIISLLLAPGLALPQLAAELRNQAKLGQALGMSEYGVFLCQGHGILQNIKSGVTALTNAMQAGSGRALMAESTPVRLEFSV